MIAEIEDIVKNKLTGYSFYYGEKGWQNLFSDEAVFPLVSMDFMPTVKFDLTAGGYIGEQYPVSLYIGHKSELEWTTLQHEDVILLATAAGRQIISNLQNYKDTNGNKIINAIEFVSADRVILRSSDDVGTSGILLQLNITPNASIPVCI